MDQKTQNELKERLLFEADNKKLPCRQAFTISSEVGCTVNETGKVCNEIGIKIVGCQLGCF
jgi:hypothetical protein